MDSKKAKIIRMLREYKKNISNKARIEKMLLFGSQAKDISKEGSDVDIICLTPKEYKERKQQIGIIQEVEKYGIEI